MMPDTNIQSPSWRELARENSRLKDELSRLREVIKGAPHHIECALTYRGPNGELNYCDEDISLCDCWKHDALKEEK